MYFISLNKEKSRLSFDVLFVRLPYSDPELSRFFLYCGGPLVSNLGLKLVTKNDLHLSLGRKITFYVIISVT